MRYAESSKLEVVFRILKKYLRDQLMVILRSHIPYNGATLPAGVTLPKSRRVLLFAHQYNKHVQNTTKYEPNDEGDLRVGC